MRNRPPNCKAYERGDQWFCDRCGFTWDLNDDDPPECQIDPVILKQIQIASNSTYGAHAKPNPEIEKKEINKMRELLKK